MYIYKHKSMKIVVSVVIIIICLNLFLALVIFGKESVANYCSSLLAAISPKAESSQRQSESQNQQTIKTKSAPVQVEAGVTEVVQPEKEQTQSIKSDIIKPSNEKLEQQLPEQEQSIDISKFILEVNVPNDLYEQKSYVCNVKVNTNGQNSPNEVKLVFEGDMENISLSAEQAEIQRDGDNVSILYKSFSPNLNFNIYAKLSKNFSFKLITYFKTDKWEATEEKSMILNFKEIPKPTVKKETIKKKPSVVKKYIPKPQPKPKPKSAKQLELEGVEVKIKSLKGHISRVSNELNKVNKQLNNVERKRQADITSGIYDEIKFNLYNQQRDQLISKSGKLNNEMSSFKGLLDFYTNSYNKLKKTIGNGS